MDTRTITRRMKGNCFTSKRYLGTFPADRLPKRPLTNTCFISNTDPHTLPGQHWVAVYVDSRGTPYYFDPYGLPPVTPYHLKFLNKAPKGRWFFNSQQVQTIRSKNCGKHCMAFLIRACGTNNPRATIDFYTIRYANLSDRTINGGLGIVTKTAADI